jgi:integrase
VAAHRLYAAYHLIALRGLRRGEACGLRWCDIDLDTGTAIISWQLQLNDASACGRSAPSRRLPVHRPVRREHAQRRDHRRAASRRVSGPYRVVPGTRLNLAPSPGRAGATNWPHPPGYRGRLLKDSVHR